MSIVQSISDVKNGKKLSEVKIFEGVSGAKIGKELGRVKIVERISDDLLFLLTYAAAISSADVDRDKIFEYSGAQEYEASEHFREVHTLAAKWGYEYAKACKYLSQKVEDKYISKFFGRMSNTLSSGEPEKNFLQHEKITREEIYFNEYERGIESLKKWTDGYTALMVSLTLVVTIILISVMIYDIGNIETVAFMIVILIMLTCGIAIFLIYKAAPSEKKIHSLHHKSREQEQIAILTRTLLPLGISTLAVLLFVGTKIELVLIAIALFTLPIGILAIIDDSNIDRRDSSFPAFVKTLGTLAGTTGITINSAMENLDKETLDCLESSVEKLHQTLSMGFDSKICWGRFIGETGSELINRCSKIFTDAVELGGDPAEVGSIVSASSLEIVLLRMKRKLVSAGFRWLAIVLHLVMVGLLMFVMEIINKFSNLINHMSESHAAMGGMGGMPEIGMSMFNVGDKLPFLYKFTFAVVLIFTISNTIVVKVVEGGGNYKFFFYGGLMSGISGLAIIIIPPIVSKVFTF